MAIDDIVKYKPQLNATLDLSIRNAKVGNPICAITRGNVELIKRNRIDETFSAVICECCLFLVVHGQPEKQLMKLRLLDNMLDAIKLLINEVGLTCNLKVYGATIYIDDIDNCSEILIAFSAKLKIFASIHGFGIFWKENSIRITHEGIEQQSTIGTFVFSSLFPSRPIIVIASNNYYDYFLGCTGDIDIIFANDDEKQFPMASKEDICTILELSEYLRKYNRLNYNEIIEIIHFEGINI